MAVPAVGWWRFDLNPVVAFWAAYVVTRPLAPRSPTGSARGTTGRASGSATESSARSGSRCSCSLVAYTAWAKRDIQPAAAEDADRHPHGLPRLGELGLDARPQPAEG